MMKDINMIKETGCMTCPLTLVKCQFLCHHMKLIHFIIRRLLSESIAHFPLST